MGTVQRSPVALINLLGAKGVGNLPSEFAGTIVPTIDVTEFCVEDSHTTGIGVQTGAAGAFPRTLTQNFSGTTSSVLYGSSAQIILGAAGGTRLSLRIGIGYATSGGNVCWLADLELAAVAGATTHVCSFILPRLRVIAPGSFLTAVCDSDAVGADHTLSIRTELATLP